RTRVPQPMPNSRNHNCQEIEDSFAYEYFNGLTESSYTHHNSISRRSACVRGSVDTPSPGTSVGDRDAVARWISEFPGGSQNSSGRLSMRWVPPTVAETSSSAEPRKSAGQGRRVDASTRLR